MEASLVCRKGTAGRGLTRESGRASTRQTELVSEFRRVGKVDAGDIMAGWREGGEAVGTGVGGDSGACVM